MTPKCRPAQARAGAVGSRGCPRLQALRLGHEAPRGFQQRQHLAAWAAHDVAEPG